MKRTVIRNGSVITVDQKIGNLPRGDILIVGDKVVEIRPEIDAEVDETIDASGMIVMPGLVNAHLHTWQTGLRSIGGGWSGSDYHRLMHANMATLFRPEDNYLATLMGALEQLNGGVTTLFDWCHNITTLEHAERSVDALEESGIRAVFGHGTAKPGAVFSQGTAQAIGDDVPFSHKPHPRERVEALRRGRFASDDRLVTLAMAILGPQFSTSEVTLHDFRLAKEFGLLSSSHAARRPEDWMSPNGFRIAADAGLLNETHNVVHGNYLGDDELKLIVDSGASVTVTSMIELHVHPRDPVTGRLRRLGALPSLGIDSVPAANSDMFNEMRFAMLFQRAVEHRANHLAGNPPLAKLPVASRDVLEWATVGGARALRMERSIGSLAPGKKADIILINGRALNVSPIHDPIHSVVQQANAFNVDTVLVDGVVRKRGGRLLFDEGVLRTRQADLEASARRIVEESGYQPIAA